jgi:hypothetical protein
MKKPLVWLRKAFPNSLLIAISLLLYHFVYGAPAAQKCDCPCAANAKLATAPQNPSGQVTILWPRQTNFLARTLHSKTQVEIDSVFAGTVDFDAPLSLSIPNGPHKLLIKQKSDGILSTISKTNETEITVSAQKPLYFQVIDNGLNIAASELDAATALGLLSGTGTKIPSGTGTVYFYWPKPSGSFGFLDSLNTDLPVYLDDKRVGVLTIGDFVVLKIPSGEHVLSLDMSLMSGQKIKEDIILGGNSTRYFHVEKQLDYHILEDSPEEAAEFTKKGLRQRQASAQ